MCSALVCSASVCERMDVMIGNREVYRTELLAKKIPAASGVGSFSSEKISLLAKITFIPINHNLARKITFAKKLSHVVSVKDLSIVQ